MAVGSSTWQQGTAGGRKPEQAATHGSRQPQAAASWCRQQQHSIAVVYLSLLPCDACRLLSFAAAPVHPLRPAGTSALRGASCSPGVRGTRCPHIGEHILLACILAQLCLCKQGSKHIVCDQQQHNTGGSTRICIAGRRLTVMHLRVRPLAHRRVRQAGHHRARAAGHHRRRARGQRRAT